MSLLLLMSTSAFLSRMAHLVIVEQAYKGQSTPDAVFEAKALMRHLCSELSPHVGELTIVDIERLLVREAGKS